MSLEFDRIREAFTGIMEISYGEAKRKLVSLWLETSLHGCSSRVSHTHPDRVMPKLGFGRHRMTNEKNSHDKIVWRREE